MYSKLVQQITSTTALSPAQLQAVLDKFHPISCKKNETVPTHNAQNYYAYFVNKGALRIFITDNEGVEKTLELSFEESWTGDIQSFLHKEASLLKITCLEPVELLRIASHDLEELLENIPALEKYFRVLYSYAYLNYFKRFYQFIGWSAKQRYEFILENQPKILNRVPLKVLASYIGVTPESLSRIRKQVN